MKEKILYLLIGMLIGAIITTGIFLVLDKSMKNRGNSNRPNQGMFTNGGFDPEDMSGATRTIQEDGSERFDFPDGRVMVRQENPNGGGASTIMND